MSLVKITETQSEFLKKYLRGTNKELTEKQAEATFGIKNLRARMSDLRGEGYRVRTRKTSTGKTAYSVSRRRIWES